MNGALEANSLAKQALSYIIQDLSGWRKGLMDNICVRWVLFVARPSRYQHKDCGTLMFSTILSRVHAIKCFHPLEVDMLPPGSQCSSSKKLVIDTSDVQMIDYFMHDHWRRAFVNIDDFVLN